MRNVGSAVCGGPAVAVWCAGGEWPRSAGSLASVVACLAISWCSHGARDSDAPGAPLRAHWGVDDPADATGSHAAIDAAFEHAFDILNLRAQAFLAKPIETMTPADLQALLNTVSTIGAK